MTLPGISFPLCSFNFSIFPTDQISASVIYDSTAVDLLRQMFARWHLCGLHDLGPDECDLRDLDHFSGRGSSTIGTNYSRGTVCSVEPV